MTRPLEYHSEVLVGLSAAKHEYASNHVALAVTVCILVLFRMFSWYGKQGRAFLLCQMANRILSILADSSNLDKELS